MPLFDYLCLGCGESSEVLVTGSEEKPQCPSCGSHNLKKLLSAHSSLSGPNKKSLPGSGDTACCGTTPTEAGCAGPGSCCGK
jgi:putative FmdB family regulatory protein